MPCATDAAAPDPATQFEAQPTCNLPHSNVISTSTHNNRERTCRLDHTPAHPCHSMREHQPHCATQLSPEMLARIPPLGGNPPVSPFAQTPAPPSRPVCNETALPPPHSAAPPLPSQMTEPDHTTPARLHEHPKPAHACIERACDPAQLSS